MKAINKNKQSIDYNAVNLLLFLNKENNVKAKKQFFTNKNKKNFQPQSIITNTTDITKSNITTKKRKRKKVDLEKRYKCLPEIKIKKKKPKKIIYYQEEPLVSSAEILALDKYYQDEKSKSILPLSYDQLLQNFKN